MTYCLKVAPAFFPLVTSKFGPWLGGELWTGGYKPVDVPYNNWLISNDGAHDGMTKLYASILQYYPYSTVAMPLQVVGHSMGGQVIQKLIREKTAALQAAGVATNRIKFIATGSPEHPVTGCSVLYPGAFPAVYPGTTAHTASCPTPAEFHGGNTVGYGLPTVVPWNVLFVARQYDGWCDANTDPANTAAADNASKGRGNIHLDYGAGILSAAAGYEYADPDSTNRPLVRYRWAPTYPTASLQSAAWFRWWARYKDQQTRPGIEAGHSTGTNGLGGTGRPVTLPTPNYAAL